MTIHDPDCKHKKMAESFNHKFVYKKNKQTKIVTCSLKKMLSYKKKFVENYNLAGCLNSLKT